MQIEARVRRQLHRPRHVACARHGGGGRAIRIRDAALRPHEQGEDECGHDECDSYRRNHSSTALRVGLRLSKEACHAEARGRILRERRRGRRCDRDFFCHRRNPPIPASRNRLDKSRLARSVAEDPPKLGHDARQGVIGHHRAGPHGLEDFLFREEMPGAADHEHQEVERFRLERQRHAGALQPVRIEIQHEVVPPVVRGHW